MIRTPDQLSDTAALLFGVPRAALFGRSRVARITQARHALAWALRQQDWSLEAIGAYLHRDHTSIIYALDRIERQSARNARLAERLAMLDTSEPAAAPIVDWRKIAGEQADEIARLRARVDSLRAALDAREGVET